MWMENRDRGRKQREKERECGKAVEFARPERNSARNALKWNAMAMRRYLSASPGVARVCICRCVCGRGLWQSDRRQLELVQCKRNADDKNNTRGNFDLLTGVRLY